MRLNGLYADSLGSAHSRQRCRAATRSTIEAWAVCSRVVHGHWPRREPYAPEVSDEAVTSLEMTSPAELRPGREAPESITLGKVDPCAPQLLHETYLRVWEALPAGGRMHWSDAAWTEE